VGPKQANEAEALDLQWGLVEGPPELGLPSGGGALIDVAIVPGTDTVFVLCDQGDNDLDGVLNEDPCEGIDNDLDGLIDEDPAVIVYRSDDGGYSWGTPSCIPIVGANEVGACCVNRNCYRMVSLLHNYRLPKLVPPLTLVCL